MKTLLTAVLFLFASLNLCGQETKVIVFGDTETNTDYKYNVIKMSPTSFLFGRIPIEFERELTDFLSVQAGIGFTFSSVLSGATSNWYSELRDDNSSNTIDNTVRKGKIGNILSFSPRLWFESDGMDGSYIAPVFRYSTYKNDVQQIEAGQPIVVRNPNLFEAESSKNLDMVVHYGYQSLNDVITWEYFAGLGIRSFTRIEQNLYRSNIGYVSAVEESIGKEVLVELGLRIGFRL